MSVSVNEAECAAAELDPDTVRRLAARINRAAAECQRLGITVFGGNNGTLRFDQQNGKPPLILADMDNGRWDGGDGGQPPVGSDGLIRGEAA